MWNNLTEDEKVPYKAKATEFNNTNIENTNQSPCSKCGMTFTSSEDLVAHLVGVHVENTSVENVLPGGSGMQSTISKCVECGRMFTSVLRLNQHRQEDHAEEPTVNIEVQASSQHGKGANEVIEINVEDVQEGIQDLESMKKAVRN